MEERCRDLLEVLPWCLPVETGEHRQYRGADNSLARPGRKQATATKL